MYIYISVVRRCRCLRYDCLTRQLSRSQQSMVLYLSRRNELPSFRDPSRRLSIVPSKISIPIICQGISVRRPFFLDKRYIAHH